MKEFHLLCIGSKSSGKTSFITLALNALYSQPPEWLNLVTNITNKNGVDDLKKNVSRMKNQLKPLNVYNPADLQAYALAIQKKEKEFILLLFDFFSFFFGGELEEFNGVRFSIDEANAESDELYNWIAARQQSQRPAGIIFTVDPFERFGSNDNPDFIPQKLLQGYERICAKAPESKLNIPLAVVITKIDKGALAEKLGGYFSVTSKQLRKLETLEAYASCSDSTIVNTLIEYRSDRIRAFLRKYRGNLVNLLDNAFFPIEYFGVSSQPDGGAIYPLLWHISSQLEY